MRRGSKMGGEKKEKHSFYSVFLFFAILPAYKRGSQYYLDDQEADHYLCI